MTELVLDGNTLYGTTFDNGSGNSGTIFKIDTDGNSFTVLHSFCPFSNTTNSDGGNPRGALCINGDTLYGTTSAGGTGGFGTIFKVKTNGTDFAVLHQFPGPPTGILGHGPWAALTVVGDNLYGAAENDGSQSAGTIFTLKTDGSGFTVLHNFTSADYGWTNSDGGLPLGGVVVSGNRLYGTAAIRGAFQSGTVFSIRLPGPAPVPIISSVTQSNGNFVLTCNTDPGSRYQVQYAADAVSSSWSNLTDVIIVTNSTLSVSDPMGRNAQRFYRVVSPGQ